MGIFRKINKLFNWSDTAFLIVCGFFMVIPGALMLFSDINLFLDYQYYYGDANVPLVLILVIGLIFLYAGFKRLHKKAKQTEDPESD